jgi:hypothetical protein
MTESARDEALRLAKEAGFDFDDDSQLLVNIPNEVFERIIVLARQRPGWVWVPEEPTSDQLKVGFCKFYLSHAERLAYYKSALDAAQARIEHSAAPKPEGKPESSGFDTLPDDYEAPR